MKKYIAITVGKLIIIIGKLFNRGSSLPGEIALKIDKKIIKHITLPKTIIAVTASSGKTSTTYMIADILRKNGYKVAHNIEGANLLSGVVTLIIKNCSLSGKTKSDVMVLEVDERYSKQVFKAVNPTHIVVGNITRDQPPRHGNFKVVFNTINSAINKDAHLFINGDDPMLPGLVRKSQKKVSYYGLCKNAESYDDIFTNNPDMIHCPKCHTRLKYNYVSFGNIGDYYCPNCDFKRPNLDYQITKITKKELIINDKYSFHPTSDIIYTYYNNLAAFAVCESIGIKPENIVNNLEHSTLKEKRYLGFKINGYNGYILSGKNENAPSYNQSLLYVSKKKGIKTFIFGFEYISLRYPYQDISWLYDIDFELLNNKDIKEVICVGPFCYDIGARINIAGIDKDKIITVKTVEEIYDHIKNTNNDIYAVLNLGTDKKLQKQLENNQIEVK